jgi:rhodanese-related sulfurtransferase/CBS domain-containing protein
MKQMLTVVSYRLPALGPRTHSTPVAVQREDVLDLLARGAQAVEVLPPAQYAEAHLPGAINLPLAALDAESAAQLDPARPIITYCSHAESDLSARAAWRLLSLGFNQVYRYASGKADRLAHGLPVDGLQGASATAGSLARPEVPTCQLDDRVGGLRPLVADERWDACVVVNDERVVLGTLSRRALEGDPSATAEACMQAGPPTVRVDANLERLCEALHRAGASSVLVTTPAGQLVGLLYRADLDDFLRRAAAGESGAAAASSPAR